MHIKPKKRLGQNFLVDKNIRHKILDNLKIMPGDAVLEIGAGRGEMTGLLAAKAKKVYALEIDKSLLPLLKDNLKGHANVEIINCDVLKFNLDSYFKGVRRRLKVVGNIPYYISTPIIEHLLMYRRKIKDIFITVQKEFALRVSAAAGSDDYASLSCFVQYYAHPEIAFNIKRASFFPAPKVDSALLRLRPRRKSLLKKKEEERLFKIIRAAFNKRRKTLRNSLKEIVPDDKLALFFAASGIDSNTRPERLSLSDFIDLSKT